MTTWLLDYYNWRVVGQYLDEFGRGLWATLTISAIALVLSLIVGVVLALVRLSGRPLLQRPVNAYIQFIRATPLLVQIYLVYYALPVIAPFTLRWDELWLGIFALVLHTAPYMGEILRVGFQSVPRGQIEGAMAVGMTPFQRLRYVILPQGFVNTIPPLLGQTAILIKDTSLLSLITIFELLSAGMVLNNERIMPTESFVTVAAGYLLIYALMLMISRRIRQRLEGPAWASR
ncbi:MAG TPA: amino acid ABC transporter permease [Burkholderiaceae bacterium]|nr:amino acid ABC transporter permease [Burkholderiaceae bacterium]